MVIYFEAHNRDGKVEYKNIRENHPNDTQHHLNTLGIWSDRNILSGRLQVDRYWIDTEIYKPARFWKEANNFMKFYFRKKKLKKLKDKSMKIEISKERLDLAIEFTKSREKISVSDLQKKFLIGYNTAVSMFEEMEKLNIIEGYNGTIYRKVL